MTLESDFKDYCNSIVFKMSDKMSVTIKEITKKLNLHYYGLSAEKKDHMHIVGSVGRNTAVESCSDLDLLFDLPESVFSRFDNYESNGQSELLQNVKEVLQERYSQTTIRGDGQVIVIEFSKYTVELVPGFRQSDGRFKYPDTHDGGRWKYTDPLSEQDECISSSRKSDGAYFNFCRIIREWKNNEGLRFGGLLIDTFVFNEFNSSDFNHNYSFSNYLYLLKDILNYICGLNEDQSFWYALGSNQKVYNKNNGKFATKARKALDKIESTENAGGNINGVLREILGNKFPKSDEQESTINKSQTHAVSYNKTEQFIENLYPVDIKYKLWIDCEVSQDGFRPFWLRESHNKYIGIRKKLTFSIVNTDCLSPYSILWKVRNVGDEAIKRNCIRGEIKKGDKSKIEHSDFNGPHFVECYLIKNKVCVARDRIRVPINNSY